MRYSDHSRASSVQCLIAGCPTQLAIEPALNVIEQGHEPKIHVQLLVAVEERRARVVGNKINLCFLVASEHDHVLEDSCGRLAEDLREFEAVSVEVNRMDVVARITHPDAVPLALLQVK